MKIIGDRSTTRRRSGAVQMVARSIIVLSFGALSLAGAAGCGSGSLVSAGAGGRGGTSTPPGGGGAAGDVAGPNCATLPVLEPLLTGLPATVHGLRVSGSSLFFVDTSAGTPGVTGATGGVRRLNADGSGDGILYDAQPGQQLIDIIAGADTLYLLQQEMIGTASRVFLYWMPQVGGTPARVDATSAGWGPNLIRFVGVDAGSVYLVNQDDVTGEARLTRVDLDSGIETVVATSPGMRSAQLVGDRLYYYDASNIYVAPAHASGPAASPVGTISCAPRTMSVTPDAIYCGGGLGITRLNLLATMATSAVDLSTVDSGEVNPSPPDGTSVYVAPMPSETESPVLTAIPRRGLRRLDDDGSVTLVSCGRGIMHDVAFNATDVFWIESRTTEAGIVDTQIFRLAK